MQSWFDVTRSTFHKEMRDKTMLRFRPSAVDLWPFDLKNFLSPVSHVRVSLHLHKFEVSTAVSFWVNRRHGTDRRTEIPTKCKSNGIDL